MEPKEKTIFGWCIYDWANSAFATTILAAVLPIYFVSIVPEGGVDINILGFKFHTFATPLWSYSVTIATALVAVSSPILGAIADYSQTKRKFLIFYCYLGALFTALLVTVGYGNYLRASIFFIMANIGFAGGNVFYNSFLPEIAAEGEREYVSGKGFAYGYLGGGLLLALNLLMIQKHDWFGIPDMAWGSRLSFLAVGIWWGIFAIPTFLYVKDKKNRVVENVRYVRRGFKTLTGTFRKIKNFRELLKFLISFLIYNDGIQTVIVMAAIFGREELGFDTLTLIGCLLMVQIIGVPSSLFMGKFAQWVGEKRTIYICLIVYCVVVIYGYFMTKPLEFWILGFLVGLVQGGSQAISRSLYSSLFPVRHSAEFFGFFAIANKFTSIFGPLIFGLVANITGSIRNSILGLIVFFLVGLMILITVDVDRGKEAARTVVIE
ncbi:MAG: MFS transporter [Deltaproteobacteria bacterium]|nr:MFS transporter [Deltaproteobacteria bacterium]